MLQIRLTSTMWRCLILYQGLCQRWNDVHGIVFEFPRRKNSRKEYVSLLQIAKTRKHLLNENFKGNLGITGISQKSRVFILSKVAVLNLRYLSQKLSVCSCIKWPVHQMLSTQVLRRGVCSAERLPDCPLSKIIRIIAIKPVLSCTE